MQEVHQFTTDFTSKLWTLLQISLETYQNACSPFPSPTFPSFPSHAMLSAQQHEQTKHKPDIQ